MRSTSNILTHNNLEQLSYTELTQLSLWSFQSQKDSKLSCTASLKQVHP